MTFNFRPYLPIDTFEPSFTHMQKVYEWLDNSDISYVRQKSINTDTFEPYIRIAMSDRSATAFILRWSNLIDVYCK